MKFKRGQKSEVMPLVGMVVDVSCQGRGDLAHVRYIIKQVKRERIEEMRGRSEDADLFDDPAYCSIEVRGQSSIIDVFPAPDRDMEIKVRYYPPMQEV